MAPATPRSTPAAAPTTAPSTAPAAAQRRAAALVPLTTSANTSPQERFGSGGDAASGAGGGPGSPARPVATGNGRAGGDSGRGISAPGLGEEARLGGVQGLVVGEPLLGRAVVVVPEQDEGLVVGVGHLHVLPEEPGHLGEVGRGV